MASYHLAVKPVSRGGGRSVVAAAAYRSGEELENPRDGLVHDYTRRHGVEHSEIIGFDGTRQELWGSTELIETRKNARLAVEVEASLPRELSPDERKALALGFAQELAAEYRAPVDVSIHNHRLKDGTEHPHAHILIGCRTVEDGQLKDRVVPMDGPEQVERWRERWAEVQNLALEQAGHEQRVDHRSLEVQHAAALERIEQAREAEQAPEQVAQLQSEADALDRTPLQHLSRGAWNAERDGIQTYRGDINREIANDNEERRRLLDQVRELKLAQDIERFAQLAREKIEQAAEIARDAWGAAKDRLQELSPFQRWKQQQVEQGQDVDKAGPEQAPDDPEQTPFQRWKQQQAEQARANEQDANLSPLQKLERWREQQAEQTREPGPQIEGPGRGDDGPELELD